MGRAALKEKPLEESECSAVLVSDWLGCERLCCLIGCQGRTGSSRGWAGPVRVCKEGQCVRAPGSGLL